MTLQKYWGQWIAIEEGIAGRGEGEEDGKETHKQRSVIDNYLIGDKSIPDTIAHLDSRQLSKL